ncbi:MAG: hypothetical protein KKH11_05585 [Candidatus Omnitrophica bacterium]|nr:hypothetical protein [Candidatus Omnitrophota bacterium]
MHTDKKYSYTRMSLRGAKRRSNPLLRLLRFARNDDCTNLRKGSLAIEYAVLVAIVVVALLGMQVYIRRALCGRWREAADTFGHGRQYEPGVTR